jgi:hypothetical protein
LEERENEDLGTYLDEDCEESDIDDEVLCTSHEMFETQVI